MVKVQCIKCSREGSLVKKQTKSKGLSYVYWYIEHHIGNKIKWCYLGKYEKLPKEYKGLIHKDTQTDTQNMHKSDKPKIVFKSEVKHKDKLPTFFQFKPQELEVAFKIASVLSVVQSGCRMIHGHHRDS